MTALFIKTAVAHYERRMARLRRVMPFVLSTIVVQSCLSAQVLSRAQGLHYPRLALLAQIEGQVLLDCSVSTEGTVTSVTVVSGPRLLAAAAVTAAKGWHFAKADRSKDASTVRLIFEFRLQGQCDTDCCTNESEEVSFYPPYRIVVTSKRLPVNAERMRSK